MSNYTPEQTEMMVNAYTESPSRETVEMLAERFDRSVKSIIGKLSREGVYRREVYVSKTGESPITKVEIVNNIAEGLGIRSETLAGLEKSPKTSLKNLEKAVAGLQQTKVEFLDPAAITLGTENYKLDWDLKDDPYYEENVPEVKL